MHVVFKNRTANILDQSHVPASLCAVPSTLPKEFQMGFHIATEKQYADEYSSCLIASQSEVPSVVGQHE